MQTRSALLLTFALLIHGMKSRSLSASGAVAAAFVALAIFTHPSNFWTWIILSFYLSSSRLTKFKAKVKSSLEEDYKIGGSRTAIQVLSNGLTGTLICLIHRFTISNLSTPTLCLTENDPVNRFHRILVFSYLGHFACCNGDTWASELGILSSKDPIHVLKWKRVPRGTNGGVSLLGLLSSLAGGTVLGLMAVLTLRSSSLHECAMDFRNVSFIIFIGAFSGLVGSLIDSILGATLQSTLYHKKKKCIVSENRIIPKKERTEIEHISGIGILDNHQVNFISSLIMAIISAVITDWYFS